MTRFFCLDLMLLQPDFLFEAKIINYVIFIIQKVEPGACMRGWVYKQACKPEFSPDRSGILPAALSAAAGR
ncbi:hypothetical protein CHU92_15345 [Flavobacterium cyanobacteriorum]|uniref:Uncharacterized protein n=1 Tax=Flavobacterium cyanobacteriorum TaxID=2022802 RepID=A0A255YRM1_9FLAO|nr:hypothetical protein CHU92_15345 [Flavobacterium cyanobacteriorum]